MLLTRGLLLCLHNYIERLSSSTSPATAKTSHALSTSVILVGAQLDAGVLELNIIPSDPGRFGPSTDPGHTTHLRCPMMRGATTGNSQQCMRCTFIISMPDNTSWDRSLFRGQSHGVCVEPKGKHPVGIFEHATSQEAPPNPSRRGTQAAEQKTVRTIYALL